MKKNSNPIPASQVWDGEKWVPTYAPTAPPKKKWSTGKKVTFAGLGAFVLLLMIAIAAVPASPRPGDGSSYPASEINDHKQVSNVPAPTPEAPVGPLTTVSDGTYEVGVDMVAGKYKGQCGENAYWARLKSDNSTGFITNDWKSDGGLMQFTTKKGEYVEVKNCTFTKQG